MDRGTIEEIKRHFGVVAEAVRADVRAVAEGQQALREELTRGLHEFHEEVRAEFQEVKAMIESAMAR